MEEKDYEYIDLLLSTCVSISQNKILFISYVKEIRFFVEELVRIAKERGIEEVYLEERDPFFEHQFLVEHNLEEIQSSGYFDKKIWDVYAERKAGFLIFETEYPHLMDDIDSEKMSLVSKISRESKPFYRELAMRCQINWSIVAYPSISWAKDVFSGMKEEEAYFRLKEAIFKTVMLDGEDPVASWTEHLKEQEIIVSKLNQANLRKIHYRNKLGTDLTLYLPEGYLFSSAMDKYVMANMPSYEIFTSPDYQKTEGIVYSTKPLNYQGLIIDEFWIRFRLGKIFEYDAKVGRDTLGNIISEYPQNSFLGECAFVEKDSPIARMNLVFKTTLIDENASCHLALGEGFPECILNGFDYSKEELLARGINVSKNHIDFMMGSDDLMIIGEDKDGKKIPIFENGEFTSYWKEKSL